MNKPLSILSIILLLSGTLHSIESNSAIILPKPTSIDIQLTLGTYGNNSIILTNISNSLLTNVAHPFQYRGALSFAISDEYGNPVKPIGLSKIHPTENRINLPVKKSSVFKFSSFNFISGTALFGYKLLPEKVYRVIAIYRPAGLNGPGFCSKELHYIYKKIITKP